MEKDLFRKESMDSVSSPEELNNYIKVVNPGIWLVTGAIFVFIIAVFIWSVIGTADIVVDAGGYSDGKNIYCYLTKDEANPIVKGMKVKIGGKISGRVTEVNEMPDNYKEMSEKLGGEKIAHALDISDDDWKYLVVIESGDSKQGIKDIQIITKRVSPINYILC